MKQLHTGYTVCNNRPTPNTEHPEPMNTQGLETIPRARILVASFLGAVLLLAPFVLFAHALAQVHA